MNFTKELLQIERDRYQYKGFLFQKLYTGGWYVIYNLQIVNHGVYKHDLEQWVDSKLKNN